MPVDITKPNTLAPAFEGADVVVSLVGIMHGTHAGSNLVPKFSDGVKYQGTPRDFDNVQWKGGENVARMARDVGAKLIHFGAIGSDPNSSIPYARTKALAEISVLEICPDATVIRPSIVFGPGDSFFNVLVQSSVFSPPNVLIVVNILEVRPTVPLSAISSRIWWRTSSLSACLCR